MLGLWLGMSLASAHGPAPSPLGVVRWTESDPLSDACGLTSVPDVVRTNIGLAFRQQDGSYAYGCPSRWGGAEAALAVAASGSQPEDGLLVADASSLWWVEDRGCSARSLSVPAGAVIHDLGEGEVPRVLMGVGDDVVLAEVDAGGVRTVRTWADASAYGLAVHPYQEQTAVVGLGDAVSVVLPEGDPRTLPERVALLRDDAPGGDAPVRILAADFDIGRAAGLQDADGRRHLVTVDLTTGEVDPWLGSPAGTVVLGPVPTLGLGFFAVVDGELLYSADGTSQSVDWTYIEVARGGNGAGRLGEIVAVNFFDPSRAGSSQDVLFTMTQISPPDRDCPDPTGTCALDWAHFGGESGWTDTLGAVCPGDPRRLPVVDDGPLGSGPGCGGGDEAAAWPVMLLLLWRPTWGSRRRRRR